MPLVDILPELSSRRTEPFSLALPCQGRPLDQCLCLRFPGIANLYFITPYHDPVGSRHHEISYHFNISHQWQILQHKYINRLSQASIYIYIYIYIYIHTYICEERVMLISLSLSLSLSRDVYIYVYINMFLPNSRRIDAQSQGSESNSKPQKGTMTGKL